MLASYGLETAYDLKDEAIRDVKGFGEMLTKNLMDWKREREAAFRFDPKSGVPVADVRAIVAKFEREQSVLLDQLERGAEQLRDSSHGPSRNSRSSRPSISSGPPRGTRLGRTWRSSDDPNRPLDRERDDPPTRTGRVTGARCSGRAAVRCCGCRAALSAAQAVCGRRKRYPSTGVKPQTWTHWPRNCSPYPTSTASPFRAASR